MNSAGKMHASEAIESGKDRRVLVVGDVMIDAYYLGEVNRISPEAPVPVVDVRKTQFRLGGAANVARNVLALGAAVDLACIVGDDDAAITFSGLMKKNGLSEAGVMQVNGRPTTVKTRVMASGQQLVRMDVEDSTLLSDADSERFLEILRKMVEANRPDVIICEDYDKGVLTDRVIRGLIEFAHEIGIPVAADPKFRQFHAYEGVTLFKPNLKELQEGLALSIDKNDDASIQEAVEAMSTALRPDFALVTLSERGVWLHDRKSGTHERIAAHPREIVDVSGAGDTVIAVAGLLLAAGVTLDELAYAANLSGGLVCEKTGVVPIDREQLLNELRERLPAS
jgi:rfaE bifunctional protein kinase chain/domain